MTLYLLKLNVIGCVHQFQAVMLPGSPQKGDIVNLVKSTQFQIISVDYFDDCKYILFSVIHVDPCSVGDRNDQELLDYLWAQGWCTTSAEALSSLGRDHTGKLKPDPNERPT